MRLTEEERQALRDAAARWFGPAAQMRVFGSRLDDTRRGGDIDLLVETTLQDPATIVDAHLRFLAEVYTRLGERKVDVLIDYPGRCTDSPVYRVAREQGVAL